MRWEAVEGHSRSWTVEDEDGRVLAMDLDEDVARKMAAAPDLMAIAERIVENVTDYPFSWEFEGDVEGPALLEELRAAIAKAKGGQ